LTIAAGRVTLRNRDSCPYLGEHRARASLWRSLSFGLLLATRFLLKPRSANRESRGLPARSPGPCGANPLAPGAAMREILERRSNGTCLGIELALNSGHLTAKPSALIRSAQPALGALNDSCVAIASPKGHARPFPEHPILERAEGTTEPLEWQASGRRASSGLYCWPWRSEAPESLGSKLAPGHALGAVSPSRPFASCILSM